MQILTVAELLDGRGIDMPPLRQVRRTFKKAPKAKGEEAQTMAMPLVPKGEEDEEQPPQIASPNA